MAKKLPALLYVFKENAGTDDECLLCWETLEEVACFDETRSVGVYKLDETIKVSAEAKVHRGSI